MSQEERPAGAGGAATGDTIDLKVTRGLACPRCGAPACRPNRRERRQGARTVVYVHTQWCCYAPYGDVSQARRTVHRG